MGGDGPDCRQIEQVLDVQPARIGLVDPFVDLGEGQRADAQVEQVVIHADCPIRDHVDTDLADGEFRRRTAVSQHARTGRSERGKRRQVRAEFAGLVGRRELASGRQVLVQRWLINSLASNLLEEQIYLLTLNEKPACRLLVDKSLPAGASNFITKASFSADGSILLFGWAFADRRWSDDRLIWIARPVQP